MGPKLDNDEDEFIEALREKRRKSFSGGFLERMDYRPTPKTAEIEEITNTFEGENVYSEKRQVTVDPYTLQPKQKITYTTKKCGCGEPITRQMLATELIQKCTVCGEMTCPSCRAETNMREYLKPQVRGQTICKACWNRFADQMLINCPNCSQHVKDYYDIKNCIHCGKQRCPSCGILKPGGVLVCPTCDQRRTDYLRAEERVNQMFDQILERF